MTEKQARQVCEQAGAPLPAGIEAMSQEKVRNTRRKTLDGIEFRSTLEADVYTLLKTWLAAGDIKNLICQPRFLLQPKMRVNGKAIREITYIADFSFERYGQHVVIDAKGYRMEVYRLKVKLFRAKYPDIVFEEWNKATLRDYGV